MLANSAPWLAEAASSSPGGPARISQWVITGPTNKELVMLSLLNYWALICSARDSSSPGSSVFTTPWCEIPSRILAPRSKEAVDPKSVVLDLHCMVPQYNGWSVRRIIKQALQDLITNRMQNLVPEGPGNFRYFPGNFRYFPANFRYFAGPD